MPSWAELGRARQAPAPRLTFPTGHPCYTKEQGGTDGWTRGLRSLLWGSLLGEGSISGGKEAALALPSVTCGSPAGGTVGRGDSAFTAAQGRGSGAPERRGQPVTMGHGAWGLQATRRVSHRQVLPHSARPLPRGSYVPSLPRNSNNQFFWGGEKHILHSYIFHSVSKIGWSWERRSLLGL